MTRKEARAPRIRPRDNWRDVVKSTKRIDPITSSAYLEHLLDCGCLVRQMMGGPMSRNCQGQKLKKVNCLKCGEKNAAS